MIRIFCDKKAKDLNNFWGHIVFHPTNAIEDDWGKLYLDKMADDGAAKTVRIYSMFEECVTLDENGEMVFDFSLTDKRIDYLVSKGFDIFLVYAFIPPWLSAEKDNTLIKPRYKGAFFYRSYPSDYEKWEEICRVYTEHLVRRYGEETVAKWKIHCYNEPDKIHFFYTNAPSYKARAEEFFKLYRGFVNAITSVSDKIELGACGFADAYEFLEHFLKLVKHSGLKFDFISCHPYGTTYSLINDETRPLNAYDPYKYIHTVKNIAELCGFENIPIVCDEWGALEEGYYGMDKCPAYEMRENELYAAYYAKLLMCIEESPICIDKFMICLSGQHELEEDFGGHRNFFSKSFYPKPIYNAHVLANKLGNEKLYHYADFSEERISVLPSRCSEDGRISVLICYADPYFVSSLPDIDTGIAFEGLDGIYCVKKQVIDRTHANAYTKFKELGRPQNPSEEIKAIIREAGELKTEECGKVSPENNIINLSMENNSVVLLELYPD